MQTLLEEITRGEFGGMDYSERGISTCWIKLPRERRISARWYSSGQRSELQMRGEKVAEWVELPDDRWSEMILRHIILKTQLHQENKLKELL